MKEMTPKAKTVISEWKKRVEAYEQAKHTLKLVLERHGMASREFNTARVDFEMAKEEFDNFEKENHAILAEYNQV